MAIYAQKFILISDTDFLGYKIMNNLFLGRIDEVLGRNLNFMFWDTYLKF